MVDQVNDNANLEERIQQSISFIQLRRTTRIIGQYLKFCAHRYSINTANHVEAFHLHYLIERVSRISTLVL